MAGAMQAFERGAARTSGAIDATLRPVTSVIRAIWLGAALLMPALTGSCGGDDAADASLRSSTTSSISAEATSVFLVRAADEWTPQNPSYPATGSSPTEPSLDWYISYQRPPAEAPQMVRLSGHRASIGELGASLVGFSLEPVEVGGSDALAGRSSDPVGPSVVLLPLADDYTAMALSYELTVAELLSWAAALDEATEAAWRSSNATAFDP